MANPERKPTIASLPLEEILDRARRGARRAVKDPTSLNPHYLAVLTSWLDENMPHAAGQSDEEFDHLMAKVNDAFEEAFDDEVKQHGERLEYISTHVMLSLNELRSLHAVARGQMEFDLMEKDDFIMLVRCVIERVATRLEASHERTGEGRLGYFDTDGPVDEERNGGLDA